ncbi:Nop domain-containing protein [Viridothelium virens]|uniref:Nop domain-containing protein n=1 Tax=Viridothelium virens TaxID=1048519 RepID=A0A6A6H0R3_VIRVR|nr:Nop domain-containing protein [Viridothelium virens]
MATLADELLNDFEEDEGQEEEDENEHLTTGDGVASTPTANVSKTREAALDGARMELDDGDEASDEDEELMNGSTVSKVMEDAEDADETKERVEKMQLGGISDVRSVANLMRSLEPVLQKITHYQNLPPEKQSKNVGSIEDNPEYKLLTQSNTMSTQIDGEIILVHKFIRDHYSTRFPELETLISNPLDYAKTVAILGNGPMDKVKSIAESSNNMVGQSLRSVLDGPSLMVVTVESSTTRGRNLDDSELQTVLNACDMTLKLDRAKHILTSYVQSRMNLFAPNLTALIGSLTAAQLLNYAGGLTGLAKTPACNIAPLGSKKQSGLGFATNVGIRHQGFLYHSPLIRNIPTDLKKQALRIVSSKVILAARVDHVHSALDGSTGEELKTQCLERLEKLTEPPPNKGVRALPAPDDKPSRKRGGRRARKAKEATAMTDLRKSQNRMAFGKEEAEVGYGTGDGTKGLGVIGQEDRGKVRREVIDQRTRAKLSKKNPGWGGGTTTNVGGMASSLKSGGAGNASTLRAQGLRTAGVGGTATAGTASSIAFTPLQGLELVDPKVREQMNRKEQAEKDRWFKGGTFTGVGGGQTSSAGGGSGFKVPELPKKRKLESD